METILIVNTGGTFNKRYNPLNGTLEVPHDNMALEAILHHASNASYELVSLVYKDSLEMNDEDRALILQVLQNSSLQKIIIVHGTDTMDLTASYLASHLRSKTIFLTGAMVPFSIDPIEATANMMLALGSMQKSEDKGVFIAMHGIVAEHTKIYKNRLKGVFQLRVEK